MFEHLFVCLLSMCLYFVFANTYSKEGPVDLSEVAPSPLIAGKKRRVIEIFLNLLVAANMVINVLSRWSPMS